MTLSVDAAIDAVRSWMADRGHVVRPRVLADRSNLVLLLDVEGEREPTSLVARVAMATSLARVGMGWLRREVDVTRFLGARGVRVTRPSTLVDEGPIEHAGFVVSFWERETLAAGALDPRDAGATLAAAHRALADRSGDDLPTWGALEEARQVFGRAVTKGVFAREERALVDAAWERTGWVAASARARTKSWQPVHGDAHLGNVLATTRGAVWTDWEDAFVGPIEWDVACVRSRADLFGEERASIAEFMLGYDAEHDPNLARDLGLARNVQVVSWLAVFAERQPEVLPRMRARLEKLAMQLETAR